MTNYFDEKSSQVTPSTFDAFGIEITSRYGKAGEIIEMMNFSRLAALSDVAHYVTKVFYDSKADLCSFELAVSVKAGDPVASALEQAALASIAQFDWFGVIYHGTSHSGING